MYNGMKQSLTAFFLTGGACIAFLLPSTYIVNFGASSLVGIVPPFTLSELIGLSLGASLATGFVNGALVFWWKKRTR
jgi:hypothetical protein